MADLISAHSEQQTDVELEAALEQALAEIQRCNGLIQQDQIEIDRLKAESRVITEHTDTILARLRVQLDALEKTA